LIGAPPGYVGFDQGGLLTDGVDQHPHSVLLLDEIEKAHPDLFNVLLQIMDHGKLTDHNGKQVDFRNVILIMTTNAGASDLAKAAFGFTRSKREGDDVEAINRLFAPEFRNRLDAIITFGHLTKEIIAKVVEKFVLQLEAQLADRDVTIELSEEAASWLIKHGYDELMGARPMARVIQEHIKKPLADELLFGRLEHGGTVKVTVAGEGEEKKLAFEYFPAEPKPKARDTGDEDDDEEDEETAGPALVEAAPRKALSAPKEKKERPKPGAVPSIPRRKDME
jgi:ATP-dependent Clp protease ATP-binding subunit ClpA